MAERDPLNFFSPYDRLPAGHENQLTRALLVLLKVSPLVHAEWLTLTAPTYSLRALQEATFSTQKRHVVSSAVEDQETRLISVFLAPEDPQSGGGDVVESERGQVLDAIIDYGELVMVVENKVFEADDLQARHINLSGSGLRVVEGQDVVLVLWRDLLEALSGLLERRLVAGAEAVLLDQFLSYIEDHFPDLGPFRVLSLCDRVPSRIERRLRQILGEAAGVEGESSPSGSRVPTPAETVAGRDAYLTVATDEIQLALYPADTLGQAVEFFYRTEAMDGARRLNESAGWAVKPNFHFGHMQRGFCWTHSGIDLESYLRLWQERIAAERSIPREAWDGYWAWLIDQGMAQADDRLEFDKHFTKTARQSATPRPGLMLAHIWSLEEAEELDAKNQFVAAVRHALQQALSALGEPALTA